MSDDIQNDGWTPVETSASAAVPGAGAASAPAGFCQDCGRPLTPESLRNVGAGVFCEPCLAARVGAPQPVPGDASPVLAAFLGIIPGVGAMYNGQYAKGFVHLAIFAVLASLKDNVHGVFGVLEIGWFFYQILDAYQTGKARREGTPLPDPLGLNHIGERMGFGRTWGFTSNVRTAPPAAAGAPAQPVTPPVPPPPTVYGSGWPAQPQPSGWVGYVPPTAFAGAPPVPPVDPATAAAAQQAPAWGHAPYSQTYTGGIPPAAPSYTAVPPVAPPVYPPVSPVDPLPPTRRLPVGAFWLIGLGLLILLANLLPDWHLGGRWLLPILLAGLSGWVFTRRFQAGGMHSYTLRWPVMLAVLAVLFTLQAAYVLTLGQTWPVLFIAFGALLLVERVTATPLPIAYAPAGAAPAAPAASEEETARATWAASAPESAEPAASREPATEWDPGNEQKGGQ